MPVNGQTDNSPIGVGRTEGNINDANENELLNDDNPTPVQHEMTQLPWKEVAIICLIQYTNAFCLTVVFPFVPFMTHDFFPSLRASQLGFYAGFLGGAFAAGSACGNILWGALSDRYGRRPVFLLGILGSVVFIMFFGFSISFIWAVSFRFLWGLVNGNIAVAKTYLSEICDDSNMARGFSLLGTAGAIARFTAPAVSGFLSCAAVKYHGLNVPVLKNFPYLLPCLISAGLCVLTWLGTFFYLKETLQRVPRDASSVRDAVSTNDVDQDDRQLLDNSKTHSETDLPGSLSDRTGLLPNIHSINQTEDDVVKIRKSPFWLCCPCSQRNHYERLAEEQKDSASCCRQSKCGISTLCLPMKDRRVFLAILIQSVLAFCGSILSELLPLLLVTNYQHGGYDFDTTEISLLYSILTIPEMVYQILIYPKMVRILGLKRVLQIAFVIGSLFFALIPSINRIAGPINTNNSSSTYILGPARHVAMATVPLVFPSRESPTLSSQQGQLDFEVLNRRKESRGLEDIDRMQNNHRIHVEQFSQLSRMDSQNNFAIQAAQSTMTYGDWSPWTNITDNLIKQCKILTGSKGDRPVPLKRIPIKVWAILVLVITGSIMARLSAFISSTIIIGNACLPKDKGTVYGIAQSVTAAFRCVGPIAGSNFFAWTEENGLSWPLNYHLVFYLLAVILNVACGMSFCLPNSINKKRVEEDEDTDERVTV